MFLYNRQKMEQVGLLVVDVNLNIGSIEIIYANNAKEIINKNQDGYKLMYDNWLVQQPMFISDKFKDQMRHIEFAARGNTKLLSDLNNFFTDSNKINVIKFLNFMRERDLTYEKAKWKHVI